MKLTLAVAALAIIFKAIGPTGFNIGIAWVAYIVVQAFLLVCDHWVTRWVIRSEQLLLQKRNSDSDRDKLIDSTR